jgi:Family of unknown function (DUF6220)
VQIARTAHLALAWLLVAGLVVQIFLAGLGVFAGASNFATHRDWGYLLEALPFFMGVAAFVGRLGRRQVWLAFGIFGLFLLQSILLLARDSTPAIAALHPVNGFVIAWLAIMVAREAWARRQAGDPAADATVPTGSATA